MMCLLLNLVDLRLISNPTLQIRAYYSMSVNIPIVNLADEELSMLLT